MALKLDPLQVVATIGRLHERVEERFPGSGLGRVAAELMQVGRRTVVQAQLLGRPRTGLRIAFGLFGLALVGALGAVFLRLDFARGELTALELVQVLESAINDVVLLGAGMFFVFTLDVRLKRRGALKALHELRSLAHIIDMHQLTKDPHALLAGGPATASSPRRDLNEWELARYLNYCSEMLALIGKLAAVYVERFDDAVTLAAVDSVEDLTTSLSRKIWQKISVLDGAPAGGDG